MRAWEIPQVYEVVQGSLADPESNSSIDTRTQT